MRIGSQIPYRKKSVFSKAVVRPEEFTKGHPVWLVSELAPGRREEFLCTGKGDEILPLPEYQQKLAGRNDLRREPMRYFGLMG